MDTNVLFPEDGGSGAGWAFAALHIDFLLNPAL